MNCGNPNTSCGERDRSAAGDALDALDVLPDYRATGSVSALESPVGRLVQGESIRILIADDPPVVRQGLRTVVDYEAGLLP